ncbi:MAG: pilus assembly protein HicB [Roseateles sp.]|uniref:pilus assembly protein HicB n=1 Tax=Roseateles sp. TaxID=1971397 RepID=UPI0039E88151
MTDTATYPLRLPRSVKAVAEKFAKEEGISLNQLVATAVAEKLAVMRTAEFFAERRERADLPALRKLLTRTGGLPPQPGEERRD